MSEIEQALQRIQPNGSWRSTRDIAGNPGKVRRFEAVVLQHMDAAYNLARWLTRNDHDAEDISQEAGLRAFRFLDGFDGEDARAWLLTIVRNTYYAWLKKNRQRKNDETFDEETYDQAAENSPATDGAAGGNPEWLVMQQASKQIIDAALERLPAGAREILILRELEELSYREIADIVKIPMGTVMSRLASARKLLREQLVRMNAQSQI